MKKKATEGLPNPNSSWFHPPERVGVPAWVIALAMVAGGAVVLGAVGLLR